MLIYIPVWIDLKLNSTIARLEAEIIYIPVWIDLKPIRHQNS